MAFADTRRSQSVAYKYSFRVSSIEGSTVKVLWEGDSLGVGENEAEKAAVEARNRGSRETIVLDSFRYDLEKQWVQRHFCSRAPSVTPIRRTPGRKGRPRILYLPLEFPTWSAGGHSWSYAASLAYEVALRSAGCDVTTINTAVIPHHKKILREMRFDQVWFHCHPRHISDFAFRQWVTDIAPVRLILCGETLTYTPEQLAADPWSASHGRTFSLWAPHITHAAFLDPADMKAAPWRGPSLWWRQAVPAELVRRVNTRPARDAAVFVGTLYPPRDRWLFDLGGLLERVESPESDLFQWTFERSHEWIQRAFDRTGARSPWWRLHALRLYGRFQIELRKHAFGNFIGALRDSLAIVSLPSGVKSYSGRVFEGMAAGRPVLTQRIAGHEQVFEEGVDGELLTYDSIEELADYLRWLQRNPERANQLAERGRRAVLDRHTVECRTAELLKFVEGA